MIRPSCFCPSDGDNPILRAKLSLRYDNIEFWTKGESLVNFGDYLGQYFVEKCFSRPKFAAEIGLARGLRPSMYRLGGSVIDDYHLNVDCQKYIGAPEDMLVYWACGAREFSKPTSSVVDKTIFLGVRGYHTRRVLGLGEATVIGDSALALPLVFPCEERPEDGPDKHVLLVPHALDDRPRSALMATTGATQILEPLISPGVAAVEDFIRRISTAGFVLAGSLHAAIVACAYDVPFAFWDSGSTIDTPFKWFDFASSVAIGTHFARTVGDGRIAYENLIKPMLRKPDVEAILRGAPFVLGSQIQPAARDQEERSKFDICVLGTSNAVMHDGYVAQISEEKSVRSLTNLSIGGSSSNLFTYRRSRLAALHPDVIIIDFCVNDTTLFSSRFQDITNIEQSLEEIACCLSSRTTIPVLLILPLLYYQSNPVPDIYRDVARRYEVPIFDGYKAVHAICKATGLEYEELFEDPFHLKRSISRCLASWMMNALDTYQRTLRQSFERQACISRTSFIPIREIARTPLPQVERSTSLVVETFSEIDHGTTVDLDLANDCCIVAFVADFANSAGILCFSGNINLRVCLSSLDLVEGGEGFVLKAWPLPQPVFAHQGFVRLHVASESEASFDVSLNHPLAEGQKQMPVKVSIAGLIVRSAGQTTCDYVSARGHVDLSEIDSDRFVSLASELLWAEMPPDRPVSPGAQ